MTVLYRIYRKYFARKDRRLGAAINDAQSRMRALIARGKTVDQKIITDILRIQETYTYAIVSPGDATAFYESYARLSLLAKGIPGIGAGSRQDYADPFEDAINDGEELLRYSAETGVPIDPVTAEPIFAAREAFTSAVISSQVRVRFYEAYAQLAKTFGDITAETIRNCGSAETHRTLAKTKRWAVVLTTIVVTVSIWNFVAGSLSKSITEGIATGNREAVELSGGLAKLGIGQQPVDSTSVKSLCQLIDKPDAGSANLRTAEEIEKLQHFAVNNRDILNAAIKLNWVLGRFERNPLSADDAPLGKLDDLRRSLQINAIVLNPAAEVSCKIAALQEIRSFATNVQTNFNVGLGAFVSIALPVAYAWLGALAYQLRLFGETIRKRTYHPSFADSARIIAAVIAGAISGLLNPAQGLALSPLAIAFLIGYGVEIYFKFFDTLLASFGAGVPSRASAATQTDAQAGSAATTVPVIRVLTTDPTPLPPRATG
jgi:hypothetical protein